MIGIYYIATGSYKVYLDGFVRSLALFRVGEAKRLVLLTDEEVDTSGYDIEVEQHRVSDAPWPIVTLLKMWYIAKYRGEYEEVYYFNANCQVVADIPACEGRMLLTRHTHSLGGDDGHVFLKVADDDPRSYAYIGVHDYVYVQGGFFGGAAEVVYAMCDDVGRWVERDLLCRVVPKWHDESYLNRWWTMHGERCKVVNVWDCVRLVRNPKFVPKK